MKFPFIGKRQSATPDPSATFNGPSFPLDTSTANFSADPARTFSQAEKDAAVEAAIADARRVLAASNAKQVTPPTPAAPKQPDTLPGTVAFTTALKLGIPEMIAKAEAEEARVNAAYQAQEAKEKAQTDAMSAVTALMATRQQAEGTAAFSVADREKAALCSNPVFVRRSCIRFVQDKADAAHANGQHPIAFALTKEADARKAELASFESANPKAAGEYLALSGRVGLWGTWSETANFAALDTPALENQINILTWTSMAARKPEHSALFTDFCADLKSRITPLEKELARRENSKPTAEQVASANLNAVRNMIPRL